MFEQLFGTKKMTKKTAKLHIEQMEDRVVPSWGSVPPATITVPTSFTSVTLNSVGDASGNASITNNENDFYRVTVVAGSATFQALTPNSNLDTVIAVYNASGSRVAYNDDISSSNTDSSVTVTLAAGTYYFGVTNYTGTAGGSYTWSIDSATPPSPPVVPPPPPAVGDAYEPNNTLAAAANLGTRTGSSTVSSLSITSGDHDYFRFTTVGAGTSGHSISINFTHSAGDLDFRLFNSAGTQVGSSEGSTNTETISLNGLAAGTYTAYVFGYNGAVNNYSLTFNAPASPPVVPPPPPPASTAAWTVFVYITASDLDTFAGKDINEMEKAVASLPSNVNVVAYWDQSSAAGRTRFATGGGTQAAWGTVGRAKIVADTNMSSIKTTFEILPEQNSGSGTTLTNFLTWGASIAPATNYALMLWNHGAGIHGSNYDDSDGGTTDFLSITETASALAAPGVPQLQVLGYDACLMAMSEIAYTLKDRAPVFVGSEELEGGNGHDYTTLFNVLKTNPQNVTAEQLGQGFVTSFGNQYVGTGVLEDTYSAIRSSAMNTLATNLKAFVTATGSATSAEWNAIRTARNASIVYGGGDFPDFRDLGDFMKRIQNNTSISSQIRNAAGNVIAALNGANGAVFSKTNDQRNSSGLAIYLPTGGAGSYASNFSAWNTATNWSTFLNNLATKSSSTSGGSSGTGRSGPAQRVTETAQFAVWSQTSQATGSFRERAAQVLAKVTKLQADEAMVRLAAAGLVVTPTPAATSQSTKLSESTFRNTFDSTLAS